jgi:hypothetical protein
MHRAENTLRFHANEPHERSRNEGGATIALTTDIMMQTETKLTFPRRALTQLKLGLLPFSFGHVSISPAPVNPNVIIVPNMLAASRARSRVRIIRSRRRVVRIDEFAGLDRLDRAELDEDT